MDRRFSDDDLGPGKIDHVSPKHPDVLDVHSRKSPLQKRLNRLNTFRDPHPLIRPDTSSGAISVPCSSTEGFRVPLV
jgi:hypothetical protein